MPNQLAKWLYDLPIPPLVALMFLLIFAWAGLAAFLEHEKKERKLRFINGFLFLLTIGGVLLMAVARGRVANAALVWNPLELFEVAKIQPEYYRSMFMNILMFFPFGLFLPYALPERVKHPMLVTIGIALLFAVLIETIQYVFSLGRAETNDLLMNAFGTLLGTLSYCVFRMLKRKQKTEGGRGESPLSE